MKRIFIIAMLSVLVALPGLAGPGCRAELPQWHPGYWWSYRAQGLVESLGAWGEIFQITQADRFEQYVLGVRKIDSEDVYISSAIIWTDRGPLVGLEFTPAETMETTVSYFCFQELPYRITGLSFPLWVGKRWTVIPEFEYQHKKYPAITAEVVGVEDVDVPLKRLPTFKIEYYRGNELIEEGWWSSHLAAWAKRSWPDGSAYALAEFWWFSPEAALDKTYEALEEAIKVFPDQAMGALALLIQYGFDPDRAWALLAGS